MKAILKYMMAFYCLFILSGLSAQDNEKHYNVLFIAVDDLNDWVGFLDGNPQTLTPNMDQLAAEGMVFESAYCASSLCNPSRTAIMSGFRPTSTGVYRNYDDLRNSPVLEKAKLLPEWLSAHGYFTLSRGKIYHTPETCNDTWNEWVPVTGNYGKPPGNPPANTGYNNIPDTELFDWGPTSARPEDTPDIRNARWAADILLNREFDKPFFLACGIFRPHLRWFVPEEYYKKFSPDTLNLPEVDEQDLADIPGISPTSDYLNTLEYNKQYEAVHGYLASINYADDCIGIIFDALSKSKYKDNTIVILWGDNGWHLGEKLRYRKFTLWEEACRVPLIIKVPGITQAGSRCSKMVNLLDLYPTITELCNIPSNTNNEGNSLLPILNKPGNTHELYTFTVTDEEKYGLRSGEYTYIQRNGNSEEFYNEIADPLEHNNQIGNPEYSKLKETYRQVLDSLLFRKPQIRTAVREHHIPGVIQAEHFDRGGENIAYYDKSPENEGFTGKSIYYREREGVDIFPCNDEGGGMMISRIEDGEWINFTIDTIQSGYYTVTIRVSGESNYNSRIDFYNNNSKFLSAAVNISSAEQGWINLNFTDIYFESSSSSTLKLVFSGDGFEINFIKFTEKEPPVNASFFNEVDKIRVYPSPVEKTIHINISELNDVMNVSLYDLRGCKYFNENHVMESVNIPIESGWPTGLYLVRLSGTYNSFTRKIFIN